MHAGGSGDAGGGEEGRREVDVEREFIVSLAALGGGHARIAHDQRSTDALLVGIPFIGETVFGVEVAVVGSEDHERVLEEALLAQRGEHAAASGVHFSGETIIIFHHRLIFFRCIEAPVIADAAFVLLVGDEGREAFEIFVGRRLGNGDDRVLVELHAGWLREKLEGVLILGVGGEEREREDKRFVGGARAQKLEGVIFVFLGDVDFGAVGLSDPVGAAVGPAEVEFILRKRAVVPFADVADMIAVAAEEAGIGLGPRRGEHGERGVAVARHPLAGEERGAAHAADRGGDAVVGEAHALFGEPIEVGRFHDWMAGCTERIVAPVVGVEHDDVERLGRRGGVRERRHKGERREGGQGDDGAEHKNETSGLFR